MGEVMKMNTRSIKRCASILLALGMSVSLTSCDTARNADSGSVTLTVMGKASDLQKSYMTRIFSMYEEETGNKLDIISYDDMEFEAEAQKEFKNGNVPDIFMHFHNSDLSNFEVADNFYYLNDEKWVNDLTDNAAAYCTDGDGNLLGLPFWENSVSGCYYNKTVLDSLGLKPASTQAEFDVLCQAVADAGYTPICWPADGCSWMIQFALDPVFADDPELLDAINKNEITYSEIPEAVNMAQWISDAADKGWFGSRYLETGWSDISPAIASGEAVMTFIWDTWFYTDFEQGNKYSVDDLALMPVFLNTADEGTYEGGNLNMMMANKNSEHLGEVLEFLDFCAEKKNYNAAFDGIPTVSCFKGQTTNIQSEMVTDASSSVEERERVSTASSRIIGYSAEDVAAAVGEMLRKKTDAAGCIKLMDDRRISAAAKQGAEGF